MIEDDDEQAYQHYHELKIRIDSAAELNDER